jgi:hypothetical protein
MTVIGKECRVVVVELLRGYVELLLLTRFAVMVGEWWIVEFQLEKGLYYLGVIEIRLCKKGRWILTLGLFV